MVNASAKSSVAPLAYTIQLTPTNCRIAIAANKMCTGKRSTRRPTVSCAIAPQIKTAVVSPPTASSEMPEIRSSTIFGNATDSVLKTNPADSATSANSPSRTTATVLDTPTPGEVLGAVLWLPSAGGDD